MYMSKAHRGTGIREEKSHGRGACPVCGRTGIMLLYEKAGEGDEKVMICKQCNAKKTK